MEIDDHLAPNINIHGISNNTIKYELRIRLDDVKYNFPSPGNEIRWIHIPTNNMDLVAVSTTAKNV